MADDTAAFFAKKKKAGKKKAFKFNANNIDASTVTHTVHVDAPALSTGQEAGIGGLYISSTSNQADGQGGENDKGSGEQWDDEALAATLTRKTAPTATGTTSELMDMRSLDPKRNEQENIAEKLRVEENKAKLAAAREGMEREAQRLKEEQEKKKEAAAAGASRFGTAAAALGGTGGKWVPPHMRAGGAGTLPKIRMGAAGGAISQKVDTQDENLFPDLAAAEAIIEQQQKQQQPVFKVAKKTPVGGGASWASKPKTENKSESPKKAEASEPEPAPAPAPAPPPAAASPEKPKTTTPAADSSPAAKTATKSLVKKKKKDLSTFKA